MRLPLVPAQHNVSRALSLSALCVVGALTLSSCGGDPLAEDSSTAAGESDSDRVTIGSADFPESQIIATIYSEALDEAGVPVEESFSIGSREVYIQALNDGSIDLIPEYAGALMTYLDSEAEATETEAVLNTLDELLPAAGLERADAAAAQNSNTLTVTEATAEEYDLETYSDVAPVADELTLGGPPEWQERYNGVVGLEDVYGIEFGNFSTLDTGGPLSLAAIMNGQVDVVNLFSSDPQITANDLVVLEDDQSLFAAENIVPVMSEGTATEQITSVLNEISAELTTKDLMEMNRRASDGDSIRGIANDWLEENGIVAES